MSEQRIPSEAEQARDIWFPKVAAVVRQLPYDKAVEMAAALIPIGRALGVDEGDISLVQLKIMAGWM